MRNLIPLLLLRPEHFVRSEAEKKVRVPHRPQCQERALAVDGQLRFDSTSRPQVESALPLADIL